MTPARYLVIAAVLLLAACASNDDRRPLTADLPHTSETVDDLLAANQPAILAAMVEAANALPFPHTVQTTFDGQELTVSVARQNAADLGFDTAKDAVFTGELPVPIVRGHVSKYWTLLSTTPEGPVTSAHYVSWDNDDPTDYLAGGVWTQISGLSGTGQSLDFESAETFAFIDGPELSPTAPPDLPGGGAARYAGFAQGFYATEYGTNPATPAITAGSTEAGNFVSTIQLTADFGARTIAGCMGCQSGIRVDELLFVDGESRERRQLGTRVLPYGFRLLPTPLQMDGAFGSSGNVRTEPIGDTGLPPGFVTSTSGSWEGRFSNVPDGDTGNPRRVAGTVGVSLQTIVGGEGALLGTFVGDLSP